MNLNSNLRYRVVGTDNNQYHWLDRTTDTLVLLKDGSPATFASLDEAINAFTGQKLAVTMNEPRDSNEELK
jgi:hypothetical protein